MNVHAKSCEVSMANQKKPGNPSTARDDLMEQELREWD